MDNDDNLNFNLKITVVILVIFSTFWMMLYFTEYVGGKIFNFFTPETITWIVATIALIFASYYSSTNLKLANKVYNSNMKKEKMPHLNIHIKNEQDGAWHSLLFVFQNDGPGDAFNIRFNKAVVEGLPGPLGETIEAAVEKYNFFHGIEYLSKPNYFVANLFQYSHHSSGISYNRGGASTPFTMEEIDKGILRLEIEYEDMDGEKHIMPPIKFNLMAYVY